MITCFWSRCWSFFFTRMIHKLSQCNWILKFVKSPRKSCGAATLTWFTYFKVFVLSVALADQNEKEYFLSWWCIHPHQPLWGTNFLKSWPSNQCAKLRGGFIHSVDRRALPAAINKLSGPVRLVIPVSMTVKRVSLLYWSTHTFDFNAWTIAGTYHSEMGCTAHGFGTFTLAHKQCGLNSSRMDSVPIICDFSSHKQQVWMFTQ